MVKRVGNLASFLHAVDLALPGLIGVIMGYGDDDVFQPGLLSLANYCSIDV